MGKKVLFFAIFVAFFANFAWAGGGREGNESRTAEDPSGFTDSVNIDSKKTGKWNYYLEAIDRAGNTTLAGPENIYIDPESDLPRVTIINPLSLMRVQGNLNIVGIAMDDDGVKSVELVVKRGRDGKGEELVRTTARGTDYWSYFLDTTDPEIWTDGFYTISSWAVDINDLSGISENFTAKQHKIATVVWNLDRKKPEINVTSHEIGALVAGNLKMKGTVADGNGIAALRYSLDGGERYLPARPVLDRRNDVYDWEININTKQFDDGPVVIWLQADDGNGTLGTAAHLLFVNNTGPDVAVVYPPSDEILNGIVSIAGYAKHPVGVASVTWKAGTAGGEFELLPGNHWWSTDIDLRGQKITSLDVEIRAVDVSGNVTTVRQRYRVDQNKDLPVITLTDPKPGALSANSLVVRGTASDDDGVSSVFYSLNNGPAVEIPCTGYFQFLVPSVPEGINNSIDVWAKDNTGQVGPKVNVKGIIVNGAAPVPSIVNFSTGAARTLVANAFYTGMTITPVPIINPRTNAVTGYEKMTMNISVKAPAVPVSGAVSFGDRGAQAVRFAGSGNTFTAAVPVPDNLEPGINRIVVKVTDRQGREVILEEFIFYATSAQESIPFVYQWVREKILSDGRYLISAEDEVLMGISSVPLRGVTVTGTNASAVDAQIDEKGRISLRALQEGDLGQITLRVQTDQGPQQIPAIRLIADFNGPTITFQGMTENAWVRTQANARFNVTGRNRIAAVQFSLDMGETWTSFGAVTAENNRNIDVSALDDGSINIMIRATSEAGKETVTSFTVQKDNTAPEGFVIMPISEARVNGTIRMALGIKEMGAINTITYSRAARTGAAAINNEIYNAASWDKDYTPRFIEMLMDSAQMPLDDSMRFTFTDKAGNTSTISAYDFIIDQQMDIPIAQIIMPFDQEVITSDFIVSGIMFDDDGIKNVQYRVDNTAWQTIDAKNGFSIPILLSSLTDNEHTVTVIAEDIYGVRSEPVVRGFRVSLKEPEGQMTNPTYEMVLKDIIELRGTSTDKNGIKTVQVSVDNGNTFNNVRGNFGTAAETVQWNYSFNTKILKDGPHVVFIRVIDRYDVPATYANMINIDNTPPEITLESPGDGSFSVGSLSVLGRVQEPNLKEITIQLRSLDGANIPANLRSRRVEPSSIVKEVLDLSGQPDGNYNVAIIVTDRADNVTRISRNFEIARLTYRNFIEVLYPLENEVVTGNFNLYGFAGGADAAGTATIRINGTDYTSTEVDTTGFYRFQLTGEAFNPGANSIVVYSNFGGSTQVASRSYSIEYKESGPWVTIDSFNFGEFAYDRPYISGKAGYVISEEDQALLADRGTDKETRAKIQSKTLDYTEISFDNGRTFIKTAGRQGKTADYRYRLETGEMPEGMHYIVVKAIFKNGEHVVTRMIVQVDKTFPVIKLISPEMGSRYNQEIAYSASASDDVELVSLTYHLRIGDKNAYEIPGFLQGLYIEATIPPFLKQIAPDFFHTIFSGGATYMDIGLGLSFFDDNVKIQVQYGFQNVDTWTSMGGRLPIRYGGHVVGIKLLASVYQLPFAPFWGPDFEWLSATFALGANFSYFDIMQEGFTQSGKSTFLSALLLQIEFPRVTIPKRKNLRTFSFFTEGQLWFVPTDVDADKNNIPVVMPKIILGLRLYIF